MTTSSEIIAFDFDGTLCDSMSELENIATEVLQDYLTEDACRMLYRWTTGLPFREQLALMFPSVPVAALEWFEREKEAVYWQAKPLEGAEEVLSKLSTKHKLLVVSSSRPHHVYEWLLHRDLEKYVEVAVDYDSKVEQLKKHQASVFVGDSDRDALMAQEAGCRFHQVHGITGTTLHEIRRIYE